MQNSLLKYFPFLFSKSKQEKQYFFHMGPAATLTALTFSSGDVWMSRHIVHINSHSHTWAHCLELLMHRLVVCLPPPLPFYPAYCDLSTHSFFGVYAPFLHILILMVNFLDSCLVLSWGRRHYLPFSSRDIPLVFIRHPFPTSTESLSLFYKNIAFNFLPKIQFPVFSPLMAFDCT